MHQLDSKHFAFHSYNKGVTYPAVSRSSKVPALAKPFPGLNNKAAANV